MRNILITGFISLLLFSCTKKNDFTFVQLSDTQLGFIRQNASVEPELQNLDIAIDYINQLKPAFVVVTGDLVHDRNNDEQFSAYIKSMSKISKEIPVYQIPGNHDISHPYEQSLQKFKDKIGEDHFSFECNGVYFIGINSSVIIDSIEPNMQNQYIWLEDELKKSMHSSDRIVFMHSPLYVNSIDEKKEYFNFSKSDRIKYLSLFSKYKVSTIISGHLHRNVETVDDNIHMVTSGPISKGLGGGKSGFSEWNIKDEMVLFKYILLDSLVYQ